MKLSSVLVLWTLSVPTILAAPADTPNKRFVLDMQFLPEGTQSLYKFSDILFFVEDKDPHHNGAAVYACTARSKCDKGY